ncbi:MAG: dihydroorotate dehydrogenase electron transfer subunit [Pirellulaceae bacterium]|jgi:dihydroorotate dehydrogenase electron transfer subunit|nr:dihydroorotate dehydrogenase electron transfer subunit [Pirellulaceae bacterium]
MIPALHATHYADAAVRRQVVVEANLPVAQDTYRLRIRCREIAQQAVPGQFVMVRLSGCDDPLLGRPLAVYDVLSDSAGRPETIDFLYHVVGRFTRRLAQYQPGQGVDVWGPLGNGFPPLTCAHLIMVAGGIGQTPFLVLAKEHLGQQRFGTPPRVVPRVTRVTLCYGARTRDLLAGVDDFVGAGIAVRLATDDGSAGYPGLVTEVLRDVLEETAGRTDSEQQVVCCGPEAMLRAASAACQARGVPCLVSLETPMACGLGICFTCVAKIRQGDGWDYRRTCVEGPVFDAADVVW